MEYEFTDELYHYGMPKRSGRYPWGSGENPYQHSGNFQARIKQMKDDGMSENDIANYLGISTTKLRDWETIARGEQRTLQLAQYRALREKGYSRSECARRMGKNESFLRSLENEEADAKAKVVRNTADFLKRQVEEKGVIDIGSGVELELGVSREKLRAAVEMLQLQGYNVYGGRVDQVTNPDVKTTIKVLATPDKPASVAYDLDNIQTILDYESKDNGATFEKKGFHYPASMDPSRVMIRYAEEGGLERDGTFELRRGVPDLDLGNSHYAQVRILIGDDRYGKGMAWYGDDSEFPPGIDAIFNTNKPKGTDPRKVFKEIKNDPNNPFGSAIKEEGGQYWYDDENGEKKLGLINKRGDEGDWGDWAKNLPSQFLSKQPMKLINRQLGLAEADKVEEFETIKSMTNPTVRKKFLMDYAEQCDADAETLQAAALPRQRYQVILPVPSLKDNEVFAPNFEDGEEVALVRYPHAGTFEIPICKVNNKNPEGRKMIGMEAQDAVGINPTVAKRLSGADFDGDTVMVIPNKGVGVKSTPPLKGLQDFDPEMEFGAREGMKVMSEEYKQKQMGIVSNLITDMTIKGAPDSDLVKAVRHSMVVIDAVKHKYDYKLSEEVNEIARLKREYQGHIEDDGSYHEGASTLISRAKSEKDVPKRQGSPRINKETGELEYKTADDDKLYYTDKNGKQQMRVTKSTKMAEAKDARELSTGHPVEEAYASYANKLKSLANEARKLYMNTPDNAYSPSAKKVYASEVKDLEDKLKISESNAPRERKAQTYANARVAALKKDDPDMPKKEQKKAAQRYLTEARTRFGAHRTQIDLTDREWEAIQAGAVTATTLKRVLRYTDSDKIRDRVTPKNDKGLSAGKQAKLASMKASGNYTNQQIADALGVSVSTLQRYIKQSNSTSKG